MVSKVLITQGTWPLAQRVGKLLQAHRTVQYGSADEVPQVLLNTGKYIRLPDANASTFEHELLRACLDNGADVLIPLGEQEIHSLVNAQQLFAEYGIAIWMPDATQLQGLDKVSNPNRRLPLLVVDRGVTVAAEQPYAGTHALSGVFTVTEPGGKLELCCIGG